MLEKYVVWLKSVYKPKGKKERLSDRTEEILLSTPYKVRIEKTLSTLRNASGEIDAAYEEINSLMKAKQLNMDSLELKLAELSSKESELKTKIEALQNVPLPAIGEFEKMLSKGDKRGAYRDYILFVSGVIVSIIVTAILKNLIINS